ncbi:hypothetical protein H0H87_010985 [Tephrocybe sp. NHM501043]|nr:hypothetical protein H0H87_010985 [Tephrocybe sp. NHM501043]
MTGPAHTPTCPITVPPAGSRCFPALKILDVCVSPAHIAFLLKPFKRHPLQRLELRQPLDTAQNDSAWAQAILQISTKFQSLKHLTMVASGMDPSPSTALFHTFEPLLSIHGLESVNLDFPWLLFSDEQFKQMASAWPELSTLRLSGSAEAPNASIASLQAFSMECPKLHGLSLPFDARRLPPTDELPVSSSRLKSLDTQYSPVDNALHTARHLDRIFPKLKTIQSNNNQRIWTEVGDLLRTFKAVRTDQKARDFELMKRVNSARWMRFLELNASLASFYFLITPSLADSLNGADRIDCLNVFITNIPHQ